MFRFYLKIAVYLLCFVMALYALSALDFNRFLKKGRVAAGQFLYILLALVMAFILGEFLMSVIYYFQV